MLTVRPGPPPTRIVRSTHTDLLSAARADALFTSHLSARSHPTHAEVAAAIRDAVRTYGGIRGCAAEVAFAYGDHPETAAPRMRWARQLVLAVYRHRSAAAAGPDLGRHQKASAPHESAPQERKPT